MGAGSINKLAQAADSGVAWAADSSSSSGSLSSRSGLSKPPLASSTAVGADSISKLAQATDSGVSWATDSSLSSSLAGRSGRPKSPLASSTAVCAGSVNEPTQAQYASMCSSGGVGCSMLSSCGSKPAS